MFHAGAGNCQNKCNSKARSASLGVSNAFSFHLEFSGMKLQVGGIQSQPSPSRTNAYSSLRLELPVCSQSNLHYILSSKN